MKGNVTSIGALGVAVVLGFGCSSAKTSDLGVAASAVQNDPRCENQDHAVDGPEFSEYIKNLDLDGDGNPDELTGDVKTGAENFFRPFPGGNGRSCGTCHIPEDGWTLSPEHVEARYQALQAARQKNPCADDPLFRSMDADDFQDDYTLLRTRALVRVHPALPPWVILTNQPDAKVVALRRAVPALNNLAHTGPYGWDKRAKTLEDQALGAVNDHMQPTHQPDAEFLRTIAVFERQIFSSPAIKALSDAIDSGGPVPDPDPPLNDMEQLGKQHFQFVCGHCHSGPSMTVNTDNRFFPPFDGSTTPQMASIAISNPSPPGFLPSLPFSLHSPELDLPTQFFTATNPNNGHVLNPVEFSDPGALLGDTQAFLPVSGGVILFGRFDIEQLHGVRKTAPYFHDHRAKDLFTVVKHYQTFFKFLRDARGLTMSPQITDDMVEPLLAYLNKL